MEIHFGDNEEEEKDVRTLFSGCPRFSQPQSTLHPKPT